MTQVIHDLWREVEKAEAEAERLESLGDMASAGMLWALAEELAADARAEEAAVEAARERRE